MTGDIPRIRFFDPIEDEFRGINRRTQSILYFADYPCRPSVLEAVGGSISNRTLVGSSSA